MDTILILCIQLIFLCNINNKCNKEVILIEECKAVQIHIIILYYNNLILDHHKVRAEMLAINNISKQTKIFKYFIISKISICNNNRTYKTIYQRMIN